MLLTVLQQVVISTTLLVTKVLHLMMQVCSTVLTFHYRWFVQWVKTPFQPKIGFKTRYGIVANPFAEGINQGQGGLLTLTKTVTTDVLLLKTLCKRDAYILSKTSFGGSFFMLYSNIKKYLEVGDLLFQEARDYLEFDLQWQLDIETKYSNDWSRYIDLKEEGKVSAEEYPIENRI